MMPIFLFLFGFALGARTCSETLAQNPRLCSAQWKVRSSVETCISGECTENDCCKTATTCLEADELFGLQSQCSFLFQKFALETKCDGIKCNSTDLCCAPFTNCREAAKEKCKENQILDPQLTCSPNGCIKEECCRDPVCGDWLNSNALNLCEDRGYVDAPADKNCVGGCDGAQCCVRETQLSCAQTYKANNYFCSRAGLVFNDQSQQVNDPCPADGCTTARCCRNMTTCEEYASTTGVNVCGVASLLNTSKECSGADCKDPAKCCYTPNTCLDAFKVNPRFCGAGSVFNREGSMDPCPSGVCTKDRCCRPSKTCGEADESLDDSQKLANQCALRQFTFDATTACTYGVNCTASVCCRPPVLQTCQDIWDIDQFSAIKWCARSGQVFEPTRPCVDGRCSADQCCRDPVSCLEVQVAKPGYCGEGGYFKPTSDAHCENDQCDQGQCCRDAQTCEEAGIVCKEGQALDGPKECFERCVPDVCCKPAQTCREAGLELRCRALGKAVNYQKICDATGCTIDVCCEDPHNCDDFLAAISFDPKLCPAIGKVAHLPSYQTCDGPCTAERCCSTPTTCADANQLAGGRLCLDRGVVNPLVLCVGAGCTPDKCCQKPQTCADVRIATSTQVQWIGAYAPTQWCSRDQFVDNFDFVVCESICTPAECCRKIDNCDEWRKVYETNNPSSGLPPFPRPICRFGEFVSGPCDGPCDEKQCCRAPQTCDAAQISCPDGLVLNGQQSCSGTSCDVATCCKKPVTCNDVDEFFCFAAGKVHQKSEPPIECTNGQCTTTQCCREPRGCDEAYLRLYTCPASSFPDHFRPCSGAGCNADTCCKRVTNCFTALSINRDFCKGYGSINSAVSYTPCVGECTQAQCCRESASTCGEAAVRVCGGAVDYFKPCSGAECTSSSHCCRQPVNCKEAIAYKNVTCPEGSAPTNLELSQCPGGQCSEETCCTQVNSCKLAAAAGLVCKLPAVLSTSASACGQGVPCNDANCCIAATTCAEATSADEPLCQGDYPIINIQTQATSCSGACDKAQCCRSPVNCREAFAFVPGLCEAKQQVFNYDALYSGCSGAECVTICCTKEETFRPTPSPSKPTSETTSEPTPRTTEGNKTVAPSSRPDKCPIAALKALIEVCVDSDFMPYRLPVNCTDDCKKLAASLIRTYASYDVTFANSCIKEILAAYSPDKYKPETIDFISKQIEARGGICDLALNSSPVLTSSLFVLGLLALGVIF